MPPSRAGGGRARAHDQLPLGQLEKTEWEVEV
jgi:hypothetical protein